MRTRALRVFCVIIVSLAVMLKMVRSDITFSHGGHIYQIVTTARTWVDAASDAALRGQEIMSGVSGALVRIDDEAENSAIFDQLIAHIPTTDFDQTRGLDGGNGAYVWIGATDSIVEGMWRLEGNGDLFWEGMADGQKIDERFN